jgi:periplasmic divalent cation tolerance protein
MPDVLLLYVTTPDDATARALADALIEARLAACANLIPGSTSIYRWKGAVETAAETVMIVKTRAGLAERARDLILALHPYETPCVVALDIAAHGSSTDFLDWVGAETGTSAEYNST